MYKIMSNRCTYPEIHYEALEPTILVEENVIWDNHESGSIQEQEAIQYADSADSTLTEAGNESYVTASGDNTTQYFSVLDSSNQTILNDISDVTINDSGIHGDDVEEAPLEGNNCIDINNGQVVLFKVDGSEELYGFQLVSDEQGNLQKYQYKVRQTIEGNLEAIPESIQILPVDNLEVPGQVEQTNTEAFQGIDVGANIGKEHTVLVKEEQFPERSTPELDNEEIFEEELDSKEGILEIATPGRPAKQEIDEDEVGDTEINEYGESNTSLTGHNTDDLEEDEAEIYYTQDVTDDNNFDYNSTIIEHPPTEDEVPTSEGHYEELFVKESHLVDDTNGVTEENGLKETENLNDSDNEEYETVEGIHVTGDTDENVYENADIRKSPSYQAATITFRKKIVKNIIRKVRIEKNDGKANLFYLVKNPEKENMGQVPCNSITIRPNPRSVLKCSLAAADAQKYDDEEEKYDKRFAKSKEAQQARLFHNFIAQTKIIHAPVRQGRLPRKQQIKPMKRTDEEIVVQEVVVSSNGFIETSEQGVLKERVPLKPTEYIQLSDSDEDFDPKIPPNRRKRKSRKRKAMVEITISDSDDESSDRSPNETDEDTNEVTTIVNLKRPRGRPPKHHDKDEDNNKEIVKRPRGRPPKYSKPHTEEEVEEEIIVIKIDNKCPKCPKSFPSEGSLRSHMQFHNFSQSKSNDTKYMCEKCGDTFKNSFLLRRHMNLHQTGSIACGICKKVFSDQAQLIAHKKTHIKMQMFKNTILPKESPRISKISVRNRCDDCGKIFSNLSALNIHKKQHKRLFCSSCKLSFHSKFTFRNHLRLDCVKKTKSPRRQGLRNEKRQTIISAPKQPEIPVSKPIAITSTGSTMAVVTNIKCDTCAMTFATYTSLFKHKVLKHGLDTPGNPTIKEPTRKSLYRNKSAHSGVRPSLGLKNAFVGLQNKLQTFKDSQKKT